MQALTKTTTAKIGRNKGHARIWLESSTLTKFGFNQGDAIAIVFTDDHIDRCIQIISEEHAKVMGDVINHHVAGRNRNGRQISIIDINNKQLSDFMRGETHARVTYTKGCISIFPYSEAAS